MIRAFKQYKAETRRYDVKPDFRKFLRWRKSLRPGSTPIADEMPWITFDAIDFLLANIAAGFRIFEYGSGGSSLFFSSRASEVYTVEHNEAWFDTVRNAVKLKNQPGWRGLLVHPAKGDLAMDPDPSDPYHYASNSPDAKGLNFKSYVSVIDKFPDAYFDLVVVDGRARSSCMKHAIHKIKTGGFLLLDNTDRSYYLGKLNEEIDTQFETVLDGYGPCPYCPEFTKTTIWKKK